MLFIVPVMFVLGLVVPSFAFRGDATFYTPSMGSCGITSSESDQVVALAVSMMGNPANPNQNPKCGGKISIFHPRTGKIHLATIVDTCYSCKHEDIDLSPSVFDWLAPSGQGRVYGVEWRFVD